MPLVYPGLMPRYPAVHLRGLVIGYRRPSLRVYGRPSLRVYGRPGSRVLGLMGLGLVLGCYGLMALALVYGLMALGPGVRPHGASEHRVHGLMALVYTVYMVPRFHGSPCLLYTCTLDLGTRPK